MEKGTHDYRRPSRYCKCGCGHPTANVSGYKAEHDPQRGTHDPGRRIRADYPDVRLVYGPDGGLVRPDYDPARSRPDEDRDSGTAERLSALYRHIDRRVADYRQAHGSRSAQKQIAEDIISAWMEIREIIG